jgi:hypothetical protein
MPWTAHFDCAGGKERLAQLDFLSGAIDGIWEPGSQSGLRDFRIAQHLSDSDDWTADVQYQLFSATRPMRTSMYENIDLCPDPSPRARRARLLDAQTLRSRS